MSSIPQIPLASASDSAPIQAQPEIEPTPVTEPQPPTEPTIAPSEPQPLEVPPIDTSEILEPLAPQATSTDAQSSLPPSLLFEHETSDVRESGEPMSLADAADIKDEKHQADLAADEELAEGLATSTSDPINRSLPEPHAPEPTPEDRMDVTMEAETSATEPVAQLPHRTQPTDESDAPPISEPAPTIAPVTTDVPADQEMADAPTPSVKVAREREDDEHEDERVAKRSKTNEADSSPAEFKVPKLPATRSNENIATRDTAAIEPPSTLTPPQHKHLQKALGTIKRQKDAAWFLAPVDFVALNIPTYPDIIKNPMDLGTIEKKLKGGEYKALEEIITDFDLILSNATAFNGPDHDVTKAARKIRGSFDDYLAKLPSSNQVELSAAEKKAQKAAAAATTKVTPARRESRSGAPNPRSPATNAGSPSSQTFALNPEGVPLIRRDSMAGDGRPKREIHPPKNRALDYGPSKPKKKKYAWELKFCQHVLDEMMKPKYQHLASPFYVPVDPVALNIPNYHKIIKKPMDLSTVGQKLKHGQYENAKEFESDVRLMFQNCYKFNQVGDYVYTAGKSLEQEFDREWERKKKWISDNAPNSNPQSQGSSPEPEEDDEDEVEDEEEEADDDGDTQLSILQKQIAAMSKQVEMIQKKKASPPAAPGKKSKNKTAKKEKKPAAPATASKKKAPGKSGKAEKIPYVTYDQKKLISDRINDLSEVKMGQALKIIRENVPHLRVSCRVEEAGPLTNKSFRMSMKRRSNSTLMNCPMMSCINY